MPLYEYICDEDGTVIELLRPMSDADEPVTDPDGKGRTFTRRQSTFASPSAGGNSLLAGNSGACCPCGKSRGACAGP